MAVRKSELVIHRLMNGDRNSSPSQWYIIPAAQLDEISVGDTLVSLFLLRLSMKSFLRSFYLCHVVEWMEKTDVRINKLLTPAGQGFDGGVCVGGYLGFQRVERRGSGVLPGFCPRTAA